MSRARHLVGSLLIVGGVVVLGDAALTVAWQEPVGALRASAAQQELGKRYAAVERRYAAPPSRVVNRTAQARAADAARATAASTHRLRMRRASVAARLDTRSDAGAPLGRLRIKKIGLSTLWVQGTDAAALRSGPGHYAGTVLPGRHGTVGIAGHRTTHGAPFRKLDQLRRGDRITVSMPYGDYAYAVDGTQIVSPDQAEVLRSTRADRLVLTACHPLWSAKQRIVVTARLVEGAGLSRAS